MPDKININLSGDVELQRMLNGIGDKVLKKVVRKAEAKAMMIVVQAAKANVRRHGSTQGYNKLAKAIGRRTKLYRQSATMVTVAGIRSKQGDKEFDPSRVGHLLEFGTAPHDITLKKPLRLTGEAGTSGRTLPAGFVIHHPGAEKKPFLRPAFDNNKGRIIGTFRRFIKDGIIDEAKKLAKK
ncbi:MAG: hypothetical protein GY832_21995 [Chloroflexi bacterium]|nr:hypothetical protein [Chloroflexota bacterium]